MSEWRLHWLEAGSDLTAWREVITSEIEAAREAVARRLRPPELDVIVRRVVGDVIPGIGMGAHSWGPNLFSVEIDPANPHYAPSLSTGTLRRLAVHEAHHCLRAAGPGYGSTLGEALVSEGLAGQFVKHLLGTSPEPWEDAVDDATLRSHWPNREARAATDYDHHGWFYGRSGVRPRWLGYTMGYRLVGDWLRTEPEMSKDDWISVTSDTVWGAMASPSLSLFAV